MKSIPTPANPRKRLSERLAWVAPYLYLLPAALILLIFTFYPLIYTLWISFFKWDLLQANPRFVGLNNYSVMIDSSQFWNAVKNTFIYILVVGPLSMIIALALALMINRLERLRVLWRTIYFLPYSATIVGMGFVWAWIFHPQLGIVNHVLDWLRWPTRTWLNDSSTALPVLIIIGTWQIVGYNMVLFMAGLSNIPRGLYEAAEIDGAGPLQRFWQVTVPMLSPTTLLVLVTTGIVLFQVFDTVQVLTGGGPARSTEVLAFLLWQEAFVSFRVGYAAALAYVMFSIVMILTLLQSFLAGRKVHYQ